jgi:hypothetical protein
MKKEDINYHSDVFDVYSVDNDVRKKHIIIINKLVIQVIQ